MLNPEFRRSQVPIAAGKDGTGRAAAAVGANWIASRKETGTSPAAMASAISTPDSRMLRGAGQRPRLESL